jgi:hypothetical protein
VADLSAVQTALAGIDAAIYAYGLCGARLSGDERQAALDAMAAHRGSRDRLRQLLTAAGATPPAAAAAYDPPFAVTGAGSARRLAGLVEDRCAGQLAAAAADLTGDDRLWAAGAAARSAVRQVHWTGAAPVWSGSS